MHPTDGLPERCKFARSRAMGRESSILFVGLDVHKDSIDIAVANAPRDAEIRHIGSIRGDLASLDKSLRKLVSRGQPLHIAYEAGPCGFVIWRHLRAGMLVGEYIEPCEVGTPQGGPLSPLLTNIMVQGPGLHELKTSSSEPTC
jgi:hypothetical protein